MIRIIATVVGSLLLFFTTGFSLIENSTLKVEVTGFKNKSATKVWVSVFAKKDFLETSLQTKSAVIVGDKISVEFDLPPGEYAVSTYHDINKNNKLDRYFFGKPKEPYGFSNNVRSLGPPAYDKCKFTINTSSKRISIKLID